MAPISLDELKLIPLFDDLPEAEILWLVEHSTLEQVEQGEQFYEENKPANRFYVVLDGELQVTRKIGGQEVVLGTTPRGIMGGELSLLYGTPSLISTCAIVPSRLLVLEEGSFRELFSACPTLSTRIFQAAFERTRTFTSTIQQHEKMAALGKLAAGLAHELNNPSAAARRAACSLREDLPRLQRETLELKQAGLDDSQIQALLSFQQDAIQNAIDASSEGEERESLSPIEKADREEALAEWLESAGAPESWELAANFVNAGVTLEGLKELAGETPTPQMGAVLAWMNSAMLVAELLNEIEQSTTRIADLVGAIKSYTYMDQGPEQEVDIHKGLENTLTVLRHKMKDVEIIREFAPNLPRVLGNGGELNQVWTNLIDNAVDALAAEPPDDGKKLWLITRQENEWVMVEISDNGPGIDKDHLSRIFEPFFTTKEVGQGTGLGLDISYRIIEKHDGTLDVQSQPGKTRLIVRLPLKRQGSPENRK